VNGSVRSSEEATTGLRRSARLIALYHREPVAPEPFYGFLAADTFEQLGPHLPRSAGKGLHVVDVGGGPGYLAEEARRRGHHCTVVEYSFPELHLHDRQPDTAVVGDGQALPLRDAVADVVHCSNVLEHVHRPWNLLEELWRVLRPGGLGYLSYTPWYSPWGGHETSPWHFVGGAYAARRFARTHGREAKNLYGRNLFKLPMTEVRSWFVGHDDLTVVWDGPRYWPPSWRPISRVPLVAEVVTWNYLVIFRRDG
jgi:SAM-dependent methyltransferase